MDRANIPVPGFPRVRACAWGGGIRYCGTAEDLIEAGVATPEMLAPRDPSRRFKFVDAEGHRYFGDCFWRTSRSRPYLCYRIIRWKPLALLRELPGAHEALEADAQFQVERRARWAAMTELAASLRAPPLPKPPKPKRPAYLRLVIDNTREAPQ